jgi:hypothetical protein
MPTTAKLEVQTKSAALTLSTAVASVASSGYTISNAVSTTANNPIDVIVEVEITTTSTAPVTTSNQQFVVFAVASVDNGATFGGSSNATIEPADEASMRFLGTVSMRTASRTYRNQFSIFSAFGFVPDAFKIILKNENGQVVNGGAVYTAEVFGTSV